MIFLWVISSVLLCFSGTSLAQNFQNYRVATVVEPPFVEKFTKSDGTSGFRGYMVDMMDTLARSLGFNYTVYEVRDQSYGSIDVSGEWSGVVAELIAGEADIGMGALTVTEERERFIDFTVPVYDSVGHTILIRRNDDIQDLITKRDLFQFATKTNPVHYVLLIVPAYFITCFVIWLFDLMTAKCRYGQRYDGQAGCGRIFWFFISPFTPPGTNIAIRLIAAIWFGLALFLVVTMSLWTKGTNDYADTVSRLETPISSIDDLAQQYKIKYAPVQGTVTMQYFVEKAEEEERTFDIAMSRNGGNQVKPEDKYINIWRYMQESGLPNSLEEGIQKVIDSPSPTEGFALIGDANALRYAELTDCRLQTVGNEFDRKPIAFGVQTGSRLKNQLNTWILKMIQQRELEQLKEKWWNQNPNKADCLRSEEQNGVVQFVLKTIGALILIGAALILSVTITLVHCCCSRPRIYEKNP